MFDFVVHNWNDVAAIVTIAGVPIGLIGLAFAFRQIKLQADVHVAAYEDGFVREYRALIQKSLQRRYSAIRLRRRNSSNL